MFNFCAAAVMFFTVSSQCAVNVFADDSSDASSIETEDVTVDASGASAAENWAQSLSIEQSVFNAELLTENLQIIVTYNCEDINENSPNKYPAELIFQSWENSTSPKADKDGAVWAKIAPAEFDDTTGTYNFKDIAEAYGTDDFSQVYNIHIGATDRAKVTCTGMKITNCKTQTYLKSEKKSSGTNLVVIIIITSKKSSKAFDLRTGEFIDKKKLSK